METTVFGAGLGMCVLVVVFFLYMNRKWCFSNTSGNFPCCDEKSLSTKTIHSFSKDLLGLMGKAYVTVAVLTSKQSVTATCRGSPLLHNWTAPRTSTLGTQLNFQRKVCVKRRRSKGARPEISEFQNTCWISGWEPSTVCALIKTTWTNPLRQPTYDGEILKALMSRTFLHLPSAFVRRQIELSRFAFIIHPSTCTSNCSWTNYE